MRIVQIVVNNSMYPNSVVVRAAKDVSEVDISNA